MTHEVRPKGRQQDVAGHPKRRSNLMNALPNSEDRRAALAMTFLFAVLAALFTSAAFALPEGAPWGSANPDAAEHCGSCHFGYDAEFDSEALTVEGLPKKAVPGESYTLEIRFDDPEAVVAGFQLLATSGGFTGQSEDVEYLGSAVRSTRAFHADSGFEWTLSWIAPDVPGASVTIYVAAVGGNDDLSPFGDRSFFKTIETAL